MQKLFLTFLMILFVINVHSQTLDNSLGTEDRQSKKFGWNTEGPGNYEFFFVAGQRYSGSFNFFDDNKRLIEIADFKNGSYHGEVVRFNNDGSLKSKGRYRHGGKISKWVYYYDSNSREEKVYSRKTPNEVRKSFFINSNGVLKEEYKALRNMKFTKYHKQYHDNGNLKMIKVLVKRVKKVYEIQEFYSTTKLAKHYFLKFDKDKEKWVYINEYKEFNKNGKIIVHQYH